MEFLQYCFCFMFWFSGRWACGILALRPGIKPAPPTTEGQVSHTGPPGKPPAALLRHRSRGAGAATWLRPGFPSCRRGIWRLLSGRAFSLSVYPASASQLSVGGCYFARGSWCCERSRNEFWRCALWWFSCSEVQVSARRSRLLTRALSPLLLLLPAGDGEQMTLGGLLGFLSIWRGLGCTGNAALNKSRWFQKPRAPPECKEKAHPSLAQLPGRLGFRAGKEDSFWLWAPPSYLTVTLAFRGRVWVSF